MKTLFIAFPFFVLFCAGCSAASKTFPSEDQVRSDIVQGGFDCDSSFASNSVIVEIKKKAIDLDQYRQLNSRSCECNIVYEYTLTAHPAEGESSPQFSSMKFIQKKMVRFGEQGASNQTDQISVKPPVKPDRD